MRTVTFSSNCEERCPFTRDYNAIRKELTAIDDHDKTCIEAALKGVNQIALDEWGSNTACQILLITDGNAGVGPASLRDSLNCYAQGGTNLTTLFSFPAKLRIVCVCSPNDPAYLLSKPLYHKLIGLVGSDGSLSIPEQISDQGIAALFQKLADSMYTNFKASLKCGELESSMYLSPVPIPYTHVTDDGERETYTVGEVIEVVGFISIPDIGSPMGVSRHLILPSLPSTPAPTIITPASGKSPMKMEIDLTADDGADDDKTPSFCVLFHGALKVENVAALVTVADNWYGFVYSWADSKKKSNLMLTILVPGVDAVPWLGDLDLLHCADGVAADALLNFPIRAAEKRSYTQSAVVWIRPAGLQSDIQKILRHAKKLPEKTQQFYKELNRLRKGALQLGFMDLLTGLAAIFEQEIMQLPPNAHPDMKVQLMHAAKALQNTEVADTKMIMPA